jgi:hypothetical protein
MILNPHVTWGDIHSPKIFPELKVGESFDTDPNLMKLAKLTYQVELS